MHKVNFEVLYGAWGIKLSDAEVEEAKKSPLRALRVKDKCFIIDSICYSKHIIGSKLVVKLKSTVVFPDL